MQQQVSTPSFVELKDEKILATAAKTNIGVVERDPWDVVISRLESFALDPVNIITALDNSIAPAPDFYVTRSFAEMRLKDRNFVFIANSGTADYVGTTEEPFLQAIADGAKAICAAGSFTFSATVSLPQGVFLFGAHPNDFFVAISVDTPAFLVGESARLESCTISGIPCISKSVVKISGGQLIHCRITDYPHLGALLCEPKSRVSWCRFESSTGSGVWSQNRYQTVENCSFVGAFNSANGIIRFESSHSSSLANLFDSSNVGVAYVIPSATCVSNKLVANTFKSSASLSLASDRGTTTVRYANTPNTFKTNENNFLVPLKKYTGQPTLDSDAAILSHQFAHDPSVDKDLTDILGSLDNFIRLNYEERSWFLTSSDPVFDLTDNHATSGIFSWDGTTLIWPDFKLNSVAAGYEWSIAAGSLAIGANQFLMAEIPRDTSASVTLIISNYKELLNKNDAQWLSLAWSPAAGYLIWMQGFRLLGSMPAFDVDGMPLPLAQFVNLSGQDPRNSILPTEPAFAGADGANVTEKLGSQSALLKELYEKTNLRYLPADDAVVSTEISAVDGWIENTDTGLPEQPTHLCQCQGSAYALCPNHGLYHWQRASGSWGAVAGCPAGTFASLSFLGTGLALLNTDGSICQYNPDGVDGYWPTAFVPSVDSSISLPLAVSRPISYAHGGQADYALQTPDYTLFTTIGGETLLYYRAENLLTKTFRVFSEAEGKLWSHHDRDTGFNVIRDPKTFLDTGSNGLNGMTPSGLPFGQRSQFFPYAEILPWDTFTQIAFDFDPVSKAYMCVYKNPVSSDYYFISGGEGTSRVLGRYNFVDFTPHCWMLDIAKRKILVVGATTLLEFSSYSAELVSGELTWSLDVLGDVDSCQGTLGIKDEYGRYHFLISNKSRSNQPTWWIYSSGSWVSEDIITDPDGFDYDMTTERQAGSGVIGRNFVGFLVRDGSRGNKPTFYSYDGTFSSQQLDAPLDGVGADSIIQGLGAVNLTELDCVAFLSASIVGQLRIFFYFYTLDAWYCHTLGTAGTYLPLTAMDIPTWTNMSGRLITVSEHKNPEINKVVTVGFYLYAPNVGIICGEVSGNYATGLTDASYLIQDSRLTNEPFSNRDHSYTLAIAVSRNDLSLQFRSFAERLPTFGAATSVTTSGDALALFDMGTKVRSISDSLWVGINSEGYLWVAASSYYRELLGQADDYDCAIVGDSLAICFRDLATNNLIFFVYNIVTETVVYSETIAATLGSTPRIILHDDSWVIVAQDDSRDGGQLIYYRRTISDPTPAVWVEDPVVMDAGDGLKPSRPVFVGTAMIVATETLLSDTKLWKNDGGWSLVATLVGFTNPELISISSSFWLIGDNRAAWSTSFDSGWQTGAYYPQALHKSITVFNDTILLALQTSSRGIGVLRLRLVDGYPTRELRGTFSSKGNLSSLLSGDEEGDFSDLSWTADLKLLYSASRNGRDRHWTLLGSNWHYPMGESILGAGRGITIGQRHFREQWWEDEVQITEKVFAWGELLPIAQRDQGSFVSLRWPNSSDAGRLFFRNNVEDDELPSGTMLASSVREWPLILGSTTQMSVGPATATNGSFLGVEFPLSYSLSPDSYLLRLNAPFSLTFAGEHTWSAFPRSYVQTGNLTFIFDPATAVGSHLVLRFAESSSLTLDSLAAPLSYWQSSNQDESVYAVVLGEVKPEGFLLYPDTLLTYGVLEPTELLALGFDAFSWEFRRPRLLSGDHAFELIPITDVMFSIRNVNHEPHGIQALSFASFVTARQLLHRDWYFYQTESLNKNVMPATDTVKSIAAKPANIIVY